MVCLHLVHSKLTRDSIGHIDVANTLNLLLCKQKEISSINYLCVAFPAPLCQFELNECCARFNFIRFNLIQIELKWFVAFGVQLFFYFLSQ